MQKYLPSKQFIARILVLTLLILLVVGVHEIYSFLKRKYNKNDQTSLIIKPEVIQKDSNNNDIPDWEESLWGLNPKKDGPSNKEFILAKRKELAQENSVSENNQPLSENDTLSREFFSIIMSLQESGNLNEASIKSVSNTIGQKIVASPIPDIYTKEQIKTVQTNIANVSDYYKTLAKLMTDYKDKNIGKELTFISVGLTRNDSQALLESKASATDYRSFGNELMKMKVPTDYVDTHISLANNYEKVAKSIESMTTMLNDPITGMKAIINYNKYTSALVADIEILSKNLK